MLNEVLSILNGNFAILRLCKSSKRGEIAYYKKSKFFVKSKNTIVYRGSHNKFQSWPTSWKITESFHYSNFMVLRLGKNYVSK